MTTEDIAEVLRDYYSKLYNCEKCSPGDKINARGGPQSDIWHYLEMSGLPKLDANRVEDLESPISNEEFLEALRDTPSGKAPGPDGFSVSYYKQYKEILAPV